MLKAARAEDLYIEGGRRGRGRSTIAGYQCFFHFILFHSLGTGPSRPRTVESVGRRKSKSANSNPYDCLSVPIWQYILVGGRAGPDTDRVVLNSHPPSLSFFPCFFRLQNCRSDLPSFCNTPYARRRKTKAAMSPSNGG